MAASSPRPLAERVEGGWKISGHKVFGSLSPVWTYLGVHAMDVSDPAAPQVIHAFLPRDTAGYHIEADVGRARDAGDRQPRHDPRRRVRARRA